MSEPSERRAPSGQAVDLAALREEYRADRLEEREVAADPLDQLARWIAEAVAAGLPDATAMTLATAGADGEPSARTVLCKGLEGDGVDFYTNLESRKARELDANPRAAAVFCWTPLQRQVIVRGTVAAIPAEEADAYFASRPRDSQLGAWASPQSRPVAGRGELDAALAAATERFAGAPVPRPAWWGGFRLSPREVEVWQGRAARLHDRLRYRREDGGWRLERLAP